MSDFLWSLKKCDKHSMKKNSSYPREYFKSWLDILDPWMQGVGVVLQVWSEQFIDGKTLTA